MKERVREEEGKKRKREEERKGDGAKEENETVSAKRRCVGLVSAEAFNIFSQGKIWRVVVMFLGETFWRILMTCLVVSLRLGRMCLQCLL